MHTYEFRRRLVCIALLVAVPLLFLSCWQPELHEMNEENTTKSSVESVVPSSASPSSAMQVFSSDAALALDPVLLEYTTLYLAPVHNLLFNQWNSPQEIGGTALFYTGLQRLYGYYYGKADLCAFYGVEGKNMDVPSNEYGQWMFPADSLEKAALANMNIPPEQMRESDLYDEKTNCYLFPQLGCLGEESVPYVTQAWQEGDLLHISYGQMSANRYTQLGMEEYYRYRGELPEASYTLTVRLLDDGGFVYVSNLEIE